MGLYNVAWDKRVESWSLLHFHLTNPQVIMQLPSKICSRPWVLHSQTSSALYLRMHILSHAWLTWPTIFLNPSFGSRANAWWLLLRLKSLCMALSLYHQNRTDFFLVITPAPLWTIVNRCRHVTWRGTRSLSRILATDRPAATIATPRACFATLILSTLPFAYIILTLS